MPDGGTVALDWCLGGTGTGCDAADAPDGAGAGGWIYQTGQGYSSTMTKRTFVRCRRWVRPREPADVAGPPQAVEETAAADKLNFFS